MQAAYEAAVAYAAERTVFGSPIGDYQLTQAKLARMAALIQATRQCSYQVARLMARAKGRWRPPWSRPTSAGRPNGSPGRPCRSTAAWGTPRNSPVSRYFVDARVLSIFEGADETLALKVIARRLIG